MPDEVPFFPQETSYSCVPACLRMVLAVNGIHLEEQQLVKACNCTAEGTSPGDLVRAAIDLGFTNTVQEHPELDDLKSALANRIFPIVWLRTMQHPLDIDPPSHAVVVVKIGKLVLLRDPSQDQAQRLVPRSEFAEAWERARRLTVLVSK